MAAVLILSLICITAITAYTIETERLISQKNARIESQRVIIRHQRAENEQLTYLLKERNQKEFEVQ